MPVLVSVVVPVHNEEGAIADVATEIAAAFGPVFGADWELIIIDDASTDATRERVLAVARAIPQLRLLTHSRQTGKSGVLRSGVFAARAEAIVTLDGDGQNPAEDALALAQSLLAAGPETGMVAGIRRNRADRLSKKWASRWANRFRKWLLRDGCDDTGCGLKAFRREVFLRLPYFDQMHRYLPSLVTREGIGILCQGVGDRLRVTGRSKYTNIGRLWVALSDLPGVMWLNRRRRDPGPVQELTGVGNRSEG